MKETPSKAVTQKRFKKVMQLMAKWGWAPKKIRTRIEPQFIGVVAFK